MARRERMSSVDHAWLRMERPVNLMMITSVFILRERLDLETLRQVIATRFLRFRRFRQRVVAASYAGASWEDDPHFDLRRHVTRTALPGEGGKAELEELVGELMGTPLDHNKPIWQYYLIEDYQGGSALISRIHHSYGDGIALAEVLLGITDPLAEAPAAPASSPDDSHEQADFIHRLFQPLESAAETTLGLGQGLLTTGLQLARTPLKTFDYARYGLRFTAEATALTLMPGDTPTRFKGSLGPIKRAAWGEPLPLSEVRTIGHALGCSINDVLLASVTGALRDYLLEKGDPVVTAAEIRAVVPVNMRTGPVGPELGNRFALVFLTLPLHIGNPLERVYHLKRQMQALRRSTQPVFTLALMNVTGRGPQQLQDFVVDLLSQKASAVMTNVPGPQQLRYLGGTAIEEIMFWVPQSGNIGMGVSILSYNGRVHFGLATDAGLVPDPENIINRFRGQFEQLLLTTLMQADWGPVPGQHEPIGPRR